MFDCPFFDRDSRPGWRGRIFTDDDLYQGQTILLYVLCYLAKCPVGNWRNLPGHKQFSLQSLTACISLQNFLSPCRIAQFRSDCYLLTLTDFFSFFGRTKWAVTIKRVGKSLLIPCVYACRYLRMRIWIRVFVCLFERVRLNINLQKFGSRGCHRVDKVDFVVVVVVVVVMLVPDKEHPLGLMWQKPPKST